MNFVVGLTAEVTILSDGCVPTDGLNAEVTIFSVVCEVGAGLKADVMISSVVCETSVLKTLLGSIASGRSNSSTGLKGDAALGLASAFTGFSLFSVVPATVPAAAAAATAAWLTESS